MGIWNEDRKSNAIMTIDYPHHEIHAGSHFFYTDAVTLAASSSQDYMITTPNTTKWAHLTFEATGSAITTVALYEGSDKTGTTAQTVFNNDRNSSTAATVAVLKGTSAGTTDGTLIYKIVSGASAGTSRSPAASKRENEILLKQNTKYILRMTSGTNDNLTNVELEWYEHTNNV